MFACGMRIYVDMWDTPSLRADFLLERKKRTTLSYGCKYFKSSGPFSAA